MAWSESDDFADASALAKGLNMLGMGLLLACGGLNLCHDVRPWGCYRRRDG
jgi:hypothetical protein